MNHIFGLSFDPGRFRATNGLWNALRLNDPWSVGYVSRLIASRYFGTKEAWEDYYYESGELRRRALTELAVETRRLLDDFSLKLRNPAVIGRIDPKLAELNYGYGRTEAELQQKADVLREAVNNGSSGLKPPLSEAEGFECVRFRTIRETWNGIIIRERRTVETLRRIFPEIVFKKSEGEKDYQYGIDYELFLNGDLLGAIQIKPQSYLISTPYTLKAQAANQRKFADYKNDFGRNVRVVVADMRGNILNRDDFIERLRRYYERHLH